VHLNKEIRALAATEKYIYMTPNDTSENEEILIDNSTHFTKIYEER